MPFDGVVSCLRVYTPAEMLAMGREVGGQAYQWEVGVVYPVGSPIPIPYLIGVPQLATRLGLGGLTPFDTLDGDWQYVVNPLKEWRLLTRAGQKNPRPYGEGIRSV